MRSVLQCSSLLLFFSGLLCSRPSDAKEEPAPADELLERLALVPGLSLVEERPAPAPGFRFLVLSFTQPIDHHRASQGTFEQTLTLLHHSFSAPMVAFTTGYDLDLVPFRDEPTALVNGNQVGIEERFFASSRPEPADYRDVTIYQAAADHHRVIKALRELYSGRWLSTGSSKGGMATVYHRRFFPDDVDGSVVYVAPNDVVNDVDAYDQFFETVGSDPSCRERLWNVQRQALLLRDESAPWLEELQADVGCTLGALGSIDQAYELIVELLEWGFWQYSMEIDCALIPGPDAYPYEILEYVEVSSVPYACDEYLYSGDFTYDYQAGTELGWPTRKYPHLADLLRYPDLDVPRTFVPADIPMEFNPIVMQDIDKWVRTAGSELLFIYGENDPWGAEPFELGAGTTDSYRYVAPGANHGYAGIATLREDDQLAAANTVRRWAGMPALGDDTRITPSGGPSPVLRTLFASELDTDRAAFRARRRL